VFAVGGTRLYGRYAKEGLDDRLCDGLATRHALTGQQCVLEPADSSTCFESNDASVRVSLHDAFQRLTHGYTAPGCTGVGRTAPDRRDARAGRRRIDPVHFGRIEVRAPSVHGPAPLGGQHASVSYGTGPTLATPPPQTQRGRPVPQMRPAKARLAAILPHRLATGQQKSGLHLGGESSW